MLSFLSFTRKNGILVTIQLYLTGVLMSKQNRVVKELELAVYLLNKRIATPHDLLKYWAVSGPCIEWCPPIEKFPSNNYE